MSPSLVLMMNEPPSMLLSPILFYFTRKSHPHPAPPLEGEGNFLIICEPVLTRIHPLCSLLIAFYSLLIAFSNVPLWLMFVIFSVPVWPGEAPLRIPTPSPPGELQRLHLLQEVLSMPSTRRSIHVSSRSPRYSRPMPQRPQG